MVNSARHGDALSRSRLVGVGVLEGSERNQYDGLSRGGGVTSHAHNVLGQLVYKHLYKHS